MKYPLLRDRDKERTVDISYRMIRRKKKERARGKGIIKDRFVYIIEEEI